MNQTSPAEAAPPPITSTLDVVPVLSQHRFSEAALEAFMERQVEGFVKPLTVRQFQGGMSNPTFLLSDGAGKNYVMRKKPPGKLLPSAHAVDREFKVIAALGPTDVPVARAYALCEDASVIGQAFYIMEHVQGRVIRNFAMPDATPAERFATYDAMNDALARLHLVDWKAVGLADYGRAGGYMGRQIKRWAEQYIASKTSEIPEMDKLPGWLMEHLPDDTETTIAHGDYRMENLIFHPTEPKVLAIVDWELGTLGNPLSDVAYCCIPYHSIDHQRGDITGLDLEAWGIPTEEEFVSAYCRRTGRPEIPNWNYYMILSLWRLAAIAQGVYRRGLDGNASSPEALKRGDKARELSEIAWKLTGK
jgi:aminoglycoside phosphotransferase (APT) family kinase protein